MITWPLDSELLEGNMVFFIDTAQSLRKCNEDYTSTYESYYTIDKRTLSRYNKTLWG